MEVTIEELEGMVYRFITHKLPLFVHGAPAIGKSETIWKMAAKRAKDLNMPLERDGWRPDAYCVLDLRAAMMDPTDVKGLPFPSKSDPALAMVDVTRWLRPEMLPKSGCGLVFVDEFNLALPLVQSAFMQLWLDRRLGDYRLPDGYSMLAAGNRASDRTHVFEQSTALNTRQAHVTLLPPGEPSVREYWLTHQGHPDIIAFNAANPQWVWKFDPASKDPAQPTPRTWTMAGRIITGMEPTSDAAIEEMYKYVGSYVGQGAALAFKGYLKTRKLLNLDDLLKHPEKVATLKETDVLFALSSGLAARYAADRKLLNPILAVLKNVVAEDLTVFTLRLMRGQHPEQFNEDIVKAPLWTSMAATFRKFLLD